MYGARAELEICMSDMIDRVATALRAAMESSPCARVQANGPNGELAVSQFFQVMAMDAIEAMREPTKDMLTAEDVHSSCHMCGGHLDGWQAMIDAALKSSSPG